MKGLVLAVSIKTNGYNSASMIQLEHVSKIFIGSEREHTALADINLTIEDGDIFGIIGESGAGKSTLVRCINLLERPTSGRILIDGNDITKLSGKGLLALRRDIGMIFQNFSLFQQRTVLQNVMFPLELTHTPKAQAEERARELLKLVGLANLAESYPSQLSGGQQQRVAIARALANSPKVMLCDEATSALDTMTTHAILNLLRDINRELGVTIILITHSMNVAEAVCNRIAVIEGGTIVEQGETKVVFANPQATITRALLGIEGSAASGIAAEAAAFVAQESGVTASVEADLDASDCCEGAGE